eukprot:2486870-Karenia_brevis.AAC.1
MMRWAERVHVTLVNPTLKSSEHGLRLSVEVDTDKIPAVEGVRWELRVAGIACCFQLSRNLPTNPGTASEPMRVDKDVDARDVDSDFPKLPREEQNEM